MIRFACLLLALACVAPAQLYRAFWVDAFHTGYKTPDEVDRLVEDVATARANVIIMESRVYADSFFVRSIEPPFEDPAYSPGFDALENLIAKAHARGIQVHAWSVVMRLWKPGDPPKDPNHIWYSHGPAAQGDDMWMTVNAAGKTSTFADPGNPGAAKHIVDAIVEPLKYYDLDGIHLDYVRYPEDDNWGWNPAAVARFQRLMNRVGAPAASDPRWSDFRRRQVTQLVRQIYLRAAAIRPKTAVSAALITWGDGPASDAGFLSTDAYRRVFQDWRGWMEEGIIDIGMPMNYFRENQYPNWLNHWLEFEKARQYRRMMVPGIAVYLNPVQSSMAQAARVLANASGVVFYSYASTNSEGRPNADFYKAAADFFGDAPNAAPALPWKTAMGHAFGWISVEDGPAWLADGVTVRIESDSGAPVSRTTLSDGTGFFGTVDLPPDRYRIRLERAGVEVYHGAAKDVNAGEALRFDALLRAAQFVDATPRITGADKQAAAAGDILTITGQVLGGDPMVLVNGVAATLLRVTPESITLLLPNQQARAWEIVVRNDGMDSAAFHEDAVDAAPVILGARRLANRYVELYCAGLGLSAAKATVQVSMQWFDFEAKPTYAGPAPNFPGLYQVNFQLPEGFTSGAVRVQVGAAASPNFVLE